MLTIRSAIDQYLAEKTALGHIRASTAKHRRQCFNALLKHLDPDTDVATVTRTQAKAVLLSLAAAGLRPTYVNTLLDVATGLFGWIELEAEAREGNPFRRMRMKATERPNERRSPFTDADLMRIWPAVTSQVDPGRRFVPELMLRLGVRPEEAAQLKRGDVVLDGDLPHLLIRAGDGQSLKNAASKRELPLVSGALAPFRSWAATRGDGFLFAKHGSAAHGRAGRISEWFTETLRRAGIEDRKKVLYSLRHTVATRLARAGVPFVQIGDLLGHERPTLVGQVYIDDSLLGQHVETLGKLSLPEEIG